MSNFKKMPPAIITGLAMSLGRRRKQKNQAANDAGKRSGRTRGKGGLAVVAVFVILLAMLVAILTAANT